MAINFPSNPQIDDQFSPPGSNVVYTWTGNYWDVYTYSATFVSASWAKTSSFAQNGAGGGTAATASYAATASTAVSLTTTASQAFTASFARNAATASYVSGSSVKGTVSSSLTASLAEDAITASFALVAQFAYSSSFSTVTQSSVSSASWASSSIWSVYATQSLTASTALSASNADSASTSRFAITASFLVGAVDTASYVEGRNVKGPLTSSISGTTAVFSTAVINSTTGSLLGTASFAVTASRAVTASYTITASAVDVPGFNTNLTYELHVSSGSGNDTTGNGTILRPFRTITRAVTWFSQSLASFTGSQTSSGLPAAAVFVHPGTYPEVVTQSFAEISITSYYGNIYDLKQSGNQSGNANDGVYINEIRQDTNVDWRGRTARYSNISVGFVNGAQNDFNRGDVVFNNCRITNLSPSTFATYSLFNCDINYFGVRTSPFSYNSVVYADSCRIATMSQNTLRDTTAWYDFTTSGYVTVRNSRLERMNWNFGRLILDNCSIKGPASYSAWSDDYLIIKNSSIVRNFTDPRVYSGLFVTGYNQTFPNAFTGASYGYLLNVSYDTGSSNVRLSGRVSGALAEPTDYTPFYSKLRVDQLSAATFSVVSVPTASHAIFANTADYAESILGRYVTGAVPSATDATNAVNATNATIASTARFLQGTGSNIVNGSLTVTGSITSTTSITASAIRTGDLLVAGARFPAMWTTTSIINGPLAAGNVSLPLQATWSFRNPATIAITKMSQLNGLGYTQAETIGTNFYVTGNLAGVSVTTGPTSGPGIWLYNGGFLSHLTQSYTVTVTWNP